MKMRLLFSIAVAWIVGVSFVEVPAAEAGMLEKVKEIYHTPERMKELQSQVEAGRSQAEQLAQQQTELLKRNEELAAHNQQLLSDIERMRAERETLYRQLTTTAVTAVLLAVGYAAAVRIWRYIVWRKQLRKSSHEATLS